MYLSSSDGANGVDIDDKFQTQQGNTSPITSAPTSPSCPTLLVIDDNSNSDESFLNTTDIPSNSIPSSNQTTQIQLMPSSPLPTNDAGNDITEKQRRRNSSIAKLLGGQPLNNQQYEDINQQIIDDQSAQNVTNNNDNGADSGIQRSRSSITRTLLMNAERNTNNNTSTTITQGRPPSPEFSKNFEYLIRRELDIEHAPSTLRSSPVSSVFQNLSSARNIPPVNAQSPSQSKLKRKRPSPKQSVPTPPTNKTPNITSFSIRDPFELDSSAPSSVPPINPTSVHRSHHHQNDLFRFDASQRHHRQPPLPPPHHHHQQQQQQQQYSLPMNNSTAYPCHKLNINSPVYAQFTIPHDRLPSTSSSSSSLSSSSLYNCCRYPPTTELALPTPVSPLSTHASSHSIIPPQTIGTSSRKTKAMHRPDLYEIPVQRSYSTISNQSNASTSSSSSSSGHSIPLKKRLLHAYKNEQRPSSSL